MITRICAKCNGEFKVYPSTIKYHPAKYCSVKCRPVPLKGRPGLSGNKNSFFGKHHTEETKEKISASKRGKISKLKGIPRSNEFKIKLSIARFHTT